MVDEDTPLHGSISVRDRLVARFGARLLATLSDELDGLVSALAKNGALGLVLVDARPLQEIERLHGAVPLRRALETLISRVGQRVHDEFGDDFVITGGPLEEEQILIFLERPRADTAFYLHEIPRLTHELRGYLRQSLRRMVYPYLHRPPELPLGHGMIFDRPFQRPETQIRKLIEATRRAARFEADRTLRERAAVLERIVLQESLSTVYEPVVDLEDERVIGYEALSRGPAGTSLEDPLTLFGVASSCDLEFELDSLCRRRALANATGIRPDQQLFLNILPSCIHDPDFEGVRVRRMLKDLGLAPENLVLEISEREAITNFPIFREALDQFTALGFGIALDDTGAGFSSLEAALELSPDYLKIDMSLIRGIEESPERQELLRGLQSVAQRMNATLIAEGIETAAELQAIRGLGIRGGQGFYLGRGSSSLRGFSLRADGETG